MEAKRPPQGRYTIMLLEDYLKRRDNSVNEFRNALIAIDRHDALRVLMDSLPGMIVLYTQGWFGLLVVLRHRQYRRSEGEG